MTERLNKVLEIRNNGYNCAQAVVGAFCEKYGIDEQTVMKLACGFGGGLRCGEVCGAVTGAVMVIGLKYGNYLPDDNESKKKCGKSTLEFMNEYKKRNQSILCRELLGYDPRDKEKVTKYADAKKQICTNAIETAIKILEDMDF